MTNDSILDAMRANVEEKQRLIDRLITDNGELLTVLKHCQVRIFMFEGNQGDTYKQADAIIDREEGRIP